VCFGAGDNIFFGLNMDEFYNPIKPEGGVVLHTDPNTWSGGI
jgi:hypothetical protein